MKIFVGSRTLAAYAPGQAERPNEAAELLTAESLHAHHLDAVYRYALRRTGRAHEAEDVAAEVFAAAAASLARFRGECSPRIWLLGIARRKVIDAQRRRARRRELLASEMPGEAEEAAALLEALTCPADGPEAQAQKEEARGVVRAILGALKEEQREALLLHYVEELPVVEAAAVMGKSPAAVNSLLQRGRAAIYRQAKGYFLEASEVEP